MKQTFHRVSKQRRCPICGKPDWCLIAPDGTAAICQRVSDRAERHLGDAGWLHRLLDSGGVTPPRAAPVIPAVSPARSPVEWRQLVDSYRVAATTDLASMLGRSLGVSVESLYRLDVGYHDGNWYFPMRDERRVIVGCRIRAPSGRKWAVRGSHNALFLPRNGLRRGRDDAPVVVCEGPTDTVAMLDLGYDAIGRPMARGCVDMLEEVCDRRHVVILADADGVGQLGARELADRLWHVCPSVRICTPPVDKDARAWVQRDSVRFVRSAIQVARRWVPEAEKMTCG